MFSLHVPPPVRPRCALLCSLHAHACCSPRATPPHLMLTFPPSEDTFPLQGGPAEVLAHLLDSFQMPLLHGGSLIPLILLWAPVLTGPCSPPPRKEQNWTAPCPPQPRGLLQGGDNPSPLPPAPGAFSRAKTWGHLVNCFPSQRGKLRLDGMRSQFSEERAGGRGWIADR